MQTKENNIRAIMFVRVSSNAQDYTRQITELTPLIKSDGYNDSEVAIIHHKESATKNNYQNRQSIQELEAYIKSSNIECVYVHEVSRLARRSDVMYKVMGLLEENHICLTIATPTLLRTYENGKSNPFAHTLFGFLAQIATQETEQRAIRSMTGRQQKLKDGKICSKCLFGYEKQNGYAVLHPQHSLTVKEIFQMISDGNTCADVFKKYKHTAFFANCTSLTTARQRVQAMIKKSSYSGENNYPAIITKEKQAQAIQALAKNQNTAKDKQRGHKDNYLCKHLVFNTNGYMMSATRQSGKPTYYTKANGILKVSAQVVDYIVWHTAIEAKSKNDATVNQELKDNATKQLPILKEQLHNIKKEIESIGAKNDKVVELYIEGAIDRQKYDAKLSQLDNHHKQLLQEQNAINIQISQLERVLNGDYIKHPTTFQTLLKSDYIQRPIRNFEELSQINDTQTQSEIIHEVVERITVERCENSHGKMAYNIYITFKNALLNNSDIWYRYQQKGCKKLLYRCERERGIDGTERVIMYDVTPEWKTA